MSFDEITINEEVTETNQSTENSNSQSTENSNSIVKRDDQLSKIANIVVETAGCNFNDVTEEAELESLGVDSLKAITVLFELEEVFDIEIPNELIPTIVTVQDIIDKINEFDKQST